jgi:hypothetical protein
MRIEKKIWPKEYKEIELGLKTFEVRLADFECRPGDVLVLREWDPKKLAYTGKVLERKVTSVVKTKDLPFWPAEVAERHGLQVIGLGK